MLYDRHIIAFLSLSDRAHYEIGSVAPWLWLILRCILILFVFYYFFNLGYKAGRRELIRQINDILKRDKQVNVKIVDTTDVRPTDP
jgi:hypothetical protein